MTATQPPAQDVSDYPFPTHLKGWNYWRNAESGEVTIMLPQKDLEAYVTLAVQAARELQQAQCPNCLNDGCHCATCNPYPGELQQAQVEVLIAIVRQKLERLSDCAEDSEGCDIGREWFDALTLMGFLERTQRSPAVWTMTQAGHAYLTTPQSSAPAVGVTDEMVERACRRYAFREDGAVWPDAYSENEVAAERVLMRELLESALTGRGS